MCVKPKTKILVAFKCPSYYISFICQFQANGLGIDYNETQDFDGELQVFWQNMQISGTSLKPIFFYVFFPKTKAHNTLCMMLNPHYKSLGLIIQFVG
jgi:hypothetical protein